MAEKDYTEDSKKWPKTPNKPWQLTKKNNNGKKSSESIWKQGKGGSGVG